VDRIDIQLDLLDAIYRELGLGIVLGLDNRRAGSISSESSFR
jgi:hypothetical protein